jgi:hypothetical protein
MPIALIVAGLGVVSLFLSAAAPRIAELVSGKPRS